MFCCGLRASVFEPTCGAFSVLLRTPQVPPFNDDELDFENKDDESMAEGEQVCTVVPRSVEGGTGTTRYLLTRSVPVGDVARRRVNTPGGSTNNNNKTRGPTRG